MPKFVEKLFLPAIATSFIALSAPNLAAAQDHVVGPKELHRVVAARSKAREANEAGLERVLSTPAARQAMRQAGVDYRTVQRGVSALSDAEVEQLAARADNAQADFAAGSISLPELMVILLAIIVVVVIVAAV